MRKYIKVIHEMTDDKVDFEQKMNIYLDKIQSKKVRVLSVHARPFDDTSMVGVIVYEAEREIYE